MISHWDKETMRHWVAQSMTKFFRATADAFFVNRYGHRAVVLETVAAVPGMVAGMLSHLKSLRTLDTQQDEFIQEMLSEAENERMHLMFFLQIAQPTWWERGMIVAAQLIFWHYYLIMYLISPKTAHLMVSYFEKEAVRSYTQYLESIQRGEILNIRCPQQAAEYYGLPDSATLADMIYCVRADEQRHQEVNQHHSENM